MEVNKIQSYNTTFGIKTSPEIIKAADKFFVKNNNSQEQFNKIYRKAKYMEEHYGFDEYTITIGGFIKNGKRMKALYATKDDNSQKPVLLCAKDNLRKLYEKYIRLSEYELNNKLL